MLVVPATASAHHLGNLVWKDTNNNGRVDVGEPGIPGVNLELRDETGAVIATTATNASGGYEFGDLRPGSFVVRIPDAATQIPGCISSTGTPGSATGPYEPAPDPNDPNDNDDNGQRVGSGVEISRPAVLTTQIQVNERIDFGFFCPAALGDFVWEDTDKDGVQDAGEPGIGGVAVTLHTVCGGPVIATTTTSASGGYLFTGLVPGTYVVDFATPTGFTSTIVVGPLNDPANSDADPATGCSPQVTLASGETNPRIDAGFVRVPTPPTPPPATVTVTPTPAPPIVPTVQSVPPARIGVSKLAPPKAVAGTVITYRITVRASGTGSVARDVVVRDILPSGVTLVSDKVQTSVRRRSVKRQRALGWDIGDLQPGASRTVTVTVRIGRGFAGQLTNTAIAQASNAPRVQDRAITTVTGLPRAVPPRVTG